MKNTIITNNTHAAIFYPRHRAASEKNSMILEERQCNFQQKCSTLQLIISSSTILATFLYLQDIDGSPRLLRQIDLPQYR
jgi:hypothetical protein